MVWRTERSYFSAAFGLARQRVRAGDRINAIAALDQIPSSSAHFTVARATAIEILLDGRAPRTLTSKRCSMPASERRHSSLEFFRQRARIRLQVLGAALDWLRAGNKSTATQLLGVTFDEPGIQGGMERSVPRPRAERRRGMWDRIALVEKANTIRPRTRL